MTNQIDGGPEAELIESAPVAVNKDKIDAIISLSERVDALGAAMDKIRKFVIARALPGDWIKFEEKLELSGPGAERVAADVGISFTNWKRWKEEGDDKNGHWFTHWYQADAHLGGRVIEQVQGRASSRDKFFGFAYKAWKEISDVKETDVQTAARRCVFKEGTKLMLGIRSIPVASAATFGLDEKQIKKVEFGEGDKKAEKAAAANSGPFIVKDVTSYQGKKDGKVAWTRYDIFVKEDEAKRSTFDIKFAEYAKTCKEKATPVMIPCESSNKGLTIIEIVPAEAKKDAAADEPKG